ncbi:MAG: type I-C CRISPR-associated protein Cas7/Csd2 [Lentimicrobium sp.]|jgi:CRISPR-associated protein Csd2|nr:type I-C CRISPR-associated protein Cas7/Csd2 [Lentimicrobium sp.]
MPELIKNRYDFALLFDVTDGNPNGDPDAGNLPRVDAETGMGLVTDVCLKRKVRNFVYMVKNAEKPNDIFIKEKSILNQLIDESHEQDEVKNKEKSGDKTEAARKWMCSNYYDIRTFGAVLSTGKNAGQVRGPIQFTFGRSVDPVVALEHSITRMAVATEAEAQKQGGDNRTMGRKFTIPYGLYFSKGFISAHLAAQTGFNEDDLSLFWEALKNMFDHDHSAARGMMCTRKLIVFKHETALGNAPAYQLFDAIKIERKDQTKPVRAFSDYALSIDKSSIPPGVELIEML